LDVIVLDDHQMVGQAIAGILSEVAGFNVLGVCCTVDTACDLIRASPPDLLVIDVQLGGDSYRPAPDLLLQLNPNAALLFVTALAEEFLAPTDLQPFTIGIVNKSQAWDSMLEVLQSWWRHRTDDLYLPLPGCEQHLRAITTLSPREQRVIEALGRGLLNKEIAVELNLSLATVETYRKGVASKLGISGSELVRIATLYRCWRWGHMD
jgi:DNA-binding NarL/FixJ family response regulator